MKQSSFLILFMIAIILGTGILIHAVWLTIGGDILAFAIVIALIDGKLSGPFVLWIRDIWIRISDRRTRWLIQLDDYEPWITDGEYTRSKVLEDFPLYKILRRIR